ncbi:hypothetical protein HMPREF2649_06455 [Staphylococcus sp. HMSC063F03]|uniref:hypothetical protein n=1 Tax=Staphylococcus TaxID=1279 RepID=UPI0008A836C6|nr:MULTISPECIES: hypothetical protein [Staphylococcus]MDO0960015.1 hypothetical protein [Staphylococcus haemolyticus]MDO0972362.1 hypothetical protein [Staphylococcus haemolyticus]OHP95720.1 hypothetical protein HMPREF2576_04195 [Staphylococcus sp. HMSC063F05]OHP96401.1 hypothetical protein HMPREF2649_06455 [Staphylococcus sp. HMSC063F03]
MNFKTNLKGLFSIEKKFNVNLLPSQLRLEDKVNLLWTTVMRIASWLLYILLIGCMVETNINKIIIYTGCILVVVLLILDISSILLISDDMRKKNYKYLFIERDKEYHLLDKYFYDISDKQVLQYTLNEKDIEIKNGEKIVGKKIVTEKIDNNESNEFIQTDSESTYRSKYISIYPIVQNIILISGIFLITFQPKNLWASLVLAIYIIFNLIFTTILSLNVNKNIENKNINEIKDKLKEERIFETKDKGIE